MGAWESFMGFLGFSQSENQAKPEQVTSRPKPQPSKPVRKSSGDMSDIYTIDAKEYADAKDIAEVFRQGVPVIVNIGDMSEADAKRILDFMLGLKAGLEGHLKRVTPKVFVLSPTNVNVNHGEESSEEEEELLS